MKTLQILLADDHAVLLAGLKVLIDTQVDMRVVGEATTGHAAVEQARTCQPDVVVMDISMPDGNGLQATLQIRKSVPTARILVLTRHDEPIYLRQLLEAGVSGYMLKRAAANDLVSAIRTVAGGGTYIDPSVADRVVAGFVAHTHGADTFREVHLTERETEVLRLTAWGYANREIAVSLHVAVKTVEACKARVMDKLDLETRTDVVRYAVCRGWMDET